MIHLWQHLFYMGFYSKNSNSTFYERTTLAIGIDTLTRGEVSMTTMNDLLCMR